LSDKYQQVINTPKDQAADPLAFLQAFHRLWIAMEDDVLTGFSPDAIKEGTIEVADKTPDPRGDAAQSDTLTELKKTILLRSSRTRSPLLQLKNLVRRFGTSKDAFELGPVSLTIPQGQIVGIVGPNGSGKTTLLRLIAGDLAESSGEVDFAGLISQVTTGPAQARGFWPSIRSKIAYVPPSPDTIYHNTELTLWITGAAHGMPSAEIERQIPVMMHKYGLSQYSNKRVSELSTGYRLRFELARILFTRPSLVVLDEPLANLDRNAQITVLEDLKMLSASVEAPRSIVISSQHIDQVVSVSDYLVFLSDGRVLFNGSRDEVSNALNYAMFEISVPDRINELERLLLTHGAIEVDRTPLSVLALFPKGTDSERVIKAIYDLGLRLNNFRDLSNSIEMMLLMPRFKTSSPDIAPSVGINEQPSG
jgi:ABC-2 type transport system ATP-binding protein